jgi:hypothetical protein
METNIEKNNNNNNDNRVTPELKERIEEAEKACNEGKCVTCMNEAEIKEYLDSL